MHVLCTFDKFYQYSLRRRNSRYTVDVVTSGWRDCVGGIR